MTKARLSREKKVDSDILKVKIGTTNIEEPKAIYIEFSGFFSPIYEKEDYKDDMRILKKAYDKLVRQFINNTYIFSDKHITVFKVAESHILKDKRSFYSIQTILKQNSENLISYNNVYDRIYPNVENIINGIKYMFETVDFKTFKTGK